MTSSGDRSAAISRRGALAGAASVAAVPLLAACGDGGEGGGPAPDPGQGSTSAGPTGSASSTPTAAPPAAGGAFATASEVPVGSGLVIAESEVVLTQPTAGEFRAFTSICTHTGCPVGEVTETINCPCHGSRFSIVDGSVEGGPASAPLSEVPITVEGDRITLA